MFNRAIVTISLLALLVTTFGCQSQPTKMYNGPELDRSQVALIQSQDSYGLFIKPKYVEIRSLDGKQLGPFGMGSIHAALVLPGKHSIHVQWNNGNRYLTGTHYAETVLTLSAEAGKTYLLRAQEIPDRKVKFWIEDLETGTKVGTPIP